MNDSLADTIVDRVDVGIFVLNEAMEVQLWNRFMQTHSGMSLEDVSGKNIIEVFPEIPERWFRRKVNGVFILKNQAFTSWQQRPFLIKFSHNRHVTGGVEFMYQNCVLIPIKDANDNVTSVCVTLYDATDEAISQNLVKEARDRLEYLSRVDALTQLYNRGYWESVLEQEFKRHKRYSDTASLLMMDLDHFKSINDNYGHTVGDDVLRAVANVLSTSIRETDLAGRYGGEEFGIIMAGTSLEGGLSLAERIRTRVEALTIQSGDVELTVTCSMGITVFDESLPTHEALIARADDALYQSKKNGRNQVTVYQADTA